MSQIRTHTVEFGGLTLQSRLAPSVARKPLVAPTHCAMCRKRENHSDAVAFVSNDYPFASDHELAIPCEHQPWLSSTAWIAALHYVRRNGLTLAYQEKGSGATIPDHGHASLFREDLPILSSQDAPQAVSSADWYPGFAIQFPPAADYDARLVATLAKLRRSRIAVNVLGEPTWGWLIIPRRGLRAASTGRRLGSVECGGIFIANLEGCDNDSYASRMSYLERQLVQFDPLNALHMIREVTVRSDSLEARKILQEALA